MRKHGGKMKNHLKNKKWILEKTYSHAGEARRVSLETGFFKRCARRRIPVF